MSSVDYFLNALRAAAESTRLRLLALCAEGELTVTELTEILGQSQPRVSRHLKLLCEAGLLERYQERTWAFYRLAERTEGAELARRLHALLPRDDPTLALDRERLDAVKRLRAERAARFFRENAARWNEIRALYVSEEEVEKALLKILGTAPMAEFLDIGTGTGRILQLMAPYAARGVGIDLSHAMLDVARVNLEEAGQHHCQVRHGNMYQLPFASQTFDAVSIHMVLHFADRPAQALAEAARVLRPGGRLAVIDFAPHDVEALRENFAHRRLGFAESEVDGWLRTAGVRPGATVRLPGDPLTVLIWHGVRDNIVRLDDSQTAIARSASL